jgi:hypothetical protein
MLAVGVFSLAIYAWAQRVALPAEAIERLIAAVPEEARVPEAAVDPSREPRFRRPGGRRTFTGTAR